MLAKILSAAALVAAPVPVQPVFIDYPLVEKVQCAFGSGTAFVAGGKIISAHHVTEMPGCSINGVPLDATREGNKDFSTAPSKVHGYKVNCEGFKANEIYWASGHAFGGPERLIMLVGTGEYADNGMAALWGAPTVIPGQSGGVIWNNRMEAVGVINMYSRIFPLSFSVELKGTSLCGAAQ